MVICLERGAHLHMAQLMPLPLTVSCFSKIQIGFTFLVPAHLGSPGQRAVKWVFRLSTAAVACVVCRRYQSIAGAQQQLRAVSCCQLTQEADHRLVRDQSMPC